MIHGSRFDLRIHGQPPAPGLAAEGPATAESAEPAEVSRGEFGYLHSYQSDSVVDGPGVRLVLWTTGCHFRCKYCHNPDTWRLGHGERVHINDVYRLIDSYTPFLRAARGGVTVSGGEPLVQSAFVLRVLRHARERGVHTALDTNGYLGERVSDAELDAIDLFLLDIKAADDARHRRYTEQPIGAVLRFAERLTRLNKRTWVRFVLVPGLTDEPETITGLAELVSQMPNVELVEVLGFHQMGRFKWRELGLPYELEHTPDATRDQVAAAVDLFRRHGIRAR